MPNDDFDGPDRDGTAPDAALTLAEQRALCGFDRPPATLPEDAAPLAEAALMVSPTNQLTRAQHAVRMRLAHEMAGYLRDEVPPVVAANLCGFSIDEVTQAMALDPVMARLLRRASAAAAYNLVQRVRSGAKGISKAALEILARTHDGWATKTQTNLESQFADALQELKARLDPSALKIVLEVFAKYSR